eukprot:COSAG06_NODE_13_length_35352_cov_49.626255_17_plen_163_part_00
MLEILDEALGLDLPICAHNERSRHPNRTNSRHQDDVVAYRHPAAPFSHSIFQVTDTIEGSSTTTTVLPQWFGALFERQGAGRTRRETGRLVLRAVLPAAGHQPNRNQDATIAWEIGRDNACRRGVVVSCSTLRENWFPVLSFERFADGKRWFAKTGSGQKDR